MIDAKSRRTIIANELALVVPEAVLAASAYPAEIDPIISPQINVEQPVIGDAALGQTLPALAFDGTNYLVIAAGDGLAGQAHSIAVDSTFIYWTDDYGGNPVGEIFRCPLAGCGGSAPFPIYPTANQPRAAVAPALPNP